MIENMAGRSSAPQGRIVSTSEPYQMETCAGDDDATLSFDSREQGKRKPGRAVSGVRLSHGCLFHSAATAGGSESRRPRNAAIFHRSCSGSKSDQPPMPE